MTVPKDILRFEALLYLSLLLDSLSAAFFGVVPDDAREEIRFFASLLGAFFIAGPAVLVWLAARRRKNWARRILFGLFVLTTVLYLGSLGEMSFGARTLVDMLSLVLSALGFYFGFTSDARRWFRPPNA